MKKLLPAVLFVCVSLHIFAQASAMPKLAVVVFTGNAPDDAATVREMVERVMIDSGKFDIVDTHNIDQILAQQKIALSSISSTENITKLKRANIKYIVTGTVRKQGVESFVSLKILDVSNAVFIPNSPGGIVAMSSMTSIYRGVSDISSDFLSGMSGSGGIVRAYRIGDSGPAGGLIFYDKGNNSDGWRYLEAAPKDLGVAQWGWYENEKRGPVVSGTGAEIGRGRRNTQLIVDALKDGGYTGRAAQLCTSFNYGGYADWFMPSKDELDLMYKNLALKGIGGFTGGYYWSSSVQGDPDNVNISVYGDDNSPFAWYQDFSDGSQFGYIKFNNCCVRAVRAF
ncbi:hypothetical protein AGMMS49944_23350 [Spirochaetia bacterium]|nr:hypothetical protein AGMMS49944_23350 [Spirochaetia bacterium]